MSGAISGLAAILLVAATCAPNGETAPEPGPDTAVTEIRGTVAITGSEPLPKIVLRTEQGGVRLITDEPHVLERLSGVEVSVRGRRHDDAFHVAEVEPLRVDGEPVVAGVVERDDEGRLWLRTLGDRRVRLLHAPAGLRPGQTIWVQGPGEIHVQRWGVYRED